MPKKTFHINRFEGGMNTDFAPEDIPSNSLLQAMGISVSEVGRITLFGNPEKSVNTVITNTAIDAGSENPGYGLYAFNSDYFTDNFTDEVATKYLVLQNGSEVKIWNEAYWNDDNTGFDMGASDTGNPTEPSYYAPNGDLRVCDGKFNNVNNYNNDVKWFGYTPNKTIGFGTADADANASAVIGGWSVQHASIEGGYPKDSSGIATNAYMVDNETNANGTSKYSIVQGTRDWGIQLSYIPASDSGTAPAFSDSTWQPNDETDYKFYASYVYDNGQEGHPTPLKMYPGYNSLDNVASVENLRFFDKANAGAKSAHIDTLTRSTTTLTVTMSEAHEFVVNDVVKIETADGTYDGSYTITGVGTTTASNDNFTVTVAASGGSPIDASANNDSVAAVVGKNLAIYFGVNLKFNNVHTTNFNFGSPYGVAADGTSTGQEGNQRITASRIYWSSSDEGHANLWIMFEANFEKGLKAYGIGKDEPTVTDYIPWSSSGGSLDWLGVDWKANGTDFNVWKHPPRYETYESLNGYAHDSKLDAKWKTAVIANGRAYIGNVKRREKATFNVTDTPLPKGSQEWGGIAPYSILKDPSFGDRILKSPVDRFDTFPEEMAIELFGGDDGDSIIKLETFADRLFVFKRDTLHILNIAKDVEILESSNKGMGLDGGLQCQSCLTSTGIAWMNSSGVYHYDGQSIESLTNNKIDAFWKGKASTIETVQTSHTAFWLRKFDGSEAYNDAPSMGYDIKSNKLILHKTSADNSGAGKSGKEEVFIYDMNIKAWTWSQETLDNANRTNMVNYDNMLIYYNDDPDDEYNFKKYDDTSSTPGNSTLGDGVSLNIVTKPYDFGTPLQRKKIYKVYVTYRCNGTSNVRAQYYTNGNPITKYNFTTGAGNNFNADDDNIALDSSIAEFDSTSGVWETAALKPATSSEANNVKSFGLYIFNDGGATVPGTFEINDITIVYRDKSIK